MNDDALAYLVPDRTRAEDIGTLAQGRWRVAEDTVEAFAQTFYDTFDWAIHCAGGVLDRRGGPPLPMLVWQDRDGDQAPLFQAAPTEPAFAADLHPGAVRARILKVAGIRRLLPVMTLELRVHTLRLRNEDDRTVVRLRVQEARFQDPRTGAEGDLSLRLGAIAVRGYEDEHAAVLALLKDTLDLVPAGRSRLPEALAAAGRVPADYSSKLDLRLDPEDPAEDAARAILLALLEILEANVPGARANLDTEFLHDLRVATRRTRSALGQIRGVFPEHRVARFKEGFAWLQQVTGAVRDLDVYLLDFDGYQASLPAPLGPRLEPLRTYLLSHYGALQRKLADELGGERCTALLRDWRAFLAAPTLPPSGGASAEHGRPANAARPVKAVADARLWRLVKRVRREGQGIRPDSPAEDLHELRKRCKKLRYLMELFQGLYPPDEIRTLVRLLKVLLDSLGTYQDLAVQCAHLRALAQRMREEDQADTDTLLAMGALVANLLVRQQAAREAFGASFAGFMTDAHQATFRALFAPRRGASPG